MKHSSHAFGLFVLLMLFIVVPQLSCAPATPAQQGRQILEDAAEAMGGLAALNAIENIDRQGTRQVSSIGHGRLTTEPAWVQPPRPYHPIIDFTVPRDLVLNSRGDVVAMSDSTKGGYRDVLGRTLVPADGTDLSLSRREWDRDIARFLVHALGQESTIEGVSETGEGQPTVSVRYIDGVLYKVHVDDATGLISRVEFTEAHDRFGDLAREWIFSDYRQVGDVQLPFSMTIKDMGMTARVLEWEEISINDPLQEDLFEIPESIREAVASFADDMSIRMTATELAKGVYFGETKGMNSMWVEFQDFVLVVEGPNNEKQSLETMRQIKETIGEKPVRYLVTTHSHEDHNGGIRTYAAAGVTIITQERNEKAIRDHLSYSFTLEPDRLAKSPQEPKIELVTDRKTITDGTRTVELLHGEAPHADGSLLIYLSRERLLFESDLFTILRGQPGAGEIRPDSQFLYDTVTHAGWRVNQIVPGHGRLIEWKELADGAKSN